MNPPKEHELKCIYKLHGLERFPQDVTRVCNKLFSDLEHTEKYT